MTSYNYNKFKSTTICGELKNEDLKDNLGNTTSNCSATFDRNLTAGFINSTTSIVANTGFNCSSSGETNQTGNLTGNGAYLLWNRDANSGKTYLINQKGSGLGGIDFQLYDETNTYLKTPLQILPTGDVSCSQTINSNAINTQLITYKNIVYDLSLLALKTSIPTSLLGVNNSISSNLISIGGDGGSTSTSTSSLSGQGQGTVLLWNRQSGDGISYFCNLRGNGDGGFKFQLFNAVGDYISTPFSINNVGASNFSNIVTNGLSLFGNIISSGATITPLIMSYLSGLTSNIQNQFSLNPIKYGEIIMSVASVAPANYLLCNGLEINRDGVYAKLFNAIGITFGGGDGTTTFSIPNFQGAFLRGLGGTGSHLGGALGVVQQDAIIDHTHTVASINNITEFTTANVVSNVAGALHTTKVLYKQIGDYSSNVSGAVSDTIKTETETRPYNYSVKYYIRY